MKNIVVIPNLNKDNALLITQKVSKLLADLGMNVYIDEKVSSGLSDVCIPYSEFPKLADLIIVIGGDGSIIDASAYGVEYDVPLLGINLGHLGYLSEVETDELETLSRLVTGEYRIVEKMLLSVMKSKGDESSVYKRLAVNDIIVSHEAFLGISEFTLITEDGESVKYRADGIILSTPAGSTAYSLSAGGPVVDHGINAILATPICPHSFFNRSVIFNENEVLTVKNTGLSVLKISIDGRLFDTLSEKEECVIFKSDKKLKMLTFCGNNTFATLFAKMKKIENM